MSAISLQHLLAGFTEAAIDPNIEIVGIQQDSRQIRPGELYMATDGSRMNLERYIDVALERGAAAVLTEPAEVFDRRDKIFQVAELKENAGPIAARFYGRPSNNMTLVGFTGTNGKTSCAYLFAQLMQAMGMKSGYIGTLGAGLLDAIEPTGFTTPPASQLQSRLYQLYAREVRLVALEVSSHALVQYRVDGTNFDIAVFTNLSRDHLDYHESMQAYGEAKERLFAMPLLRKAVINIDDPFGERLAKKIEARVEVVRVSLNNSSADIFARDIRVSESATELLIISNGKEYPAKTSLIGEFNIANLLLVIATAVAAGESMPDIVKQTFGLQAPAGRMQRVAPMQPVVVVDYAHTPDALQKVCLSLRAQLQSRLIVVFGCGGDRDIGKRPLMGAIAAAHADVTILTSDNPRSEDPAEIIEQILQGMPVGSVVMVEPDRKKAIQMAVSQASKGDVVVIAGKGHEQYQEVQGEKLAFDDVAVARQSLGVSK